MVYFFSPRSSVFNNNKGNAIYLRRSQLSFDGYVRFSDNQALNGGAVYVWEKAIGETSSLGKHGFVVYNEELLHKHIKST